MPGQVYSDGPAHIARDWIERNYRSPTCRTSTIAKVVGFESSRLCHLYLRAFGEPMGRTIRSLRVRHAARLIREQPELLLKEVADAVGYGANSYRTFFNAFLAETGVKPRDYQVGVQFRARARAERARKS